MSIALSIFALAVSQSGDPLPNSRDLANAAVTTAYYPRESIKKGEEGIVGFRVQLDSKGRLVSCEVTRSSGFVRLDTATCDVIVDTAYFNRVRGADGVGHASTHDGEIAWTLSGHGPKAMPNFAAAAEFKERIICKRQPFHGSSVITQKICLSRSDWDRQRNYAQDELHDMQTPKGPPTSLN